MGRLDNLRQALRTRRTSGNRAVRLGAKAITGAYRLGRTLIVGKYRSAAILTLFHSRKLHQSTPHTAMNRYPAIFSACRAYFGDRKDLKILSFGCCTGEEVLTLRDYFPSAHIVGAEINKHSLAVCKQRQVDERIAFVYSALEILAKHGPYDAIFCMAVLQRRPQAVIDEAITSLKRIYPFEKFDSQVSELDLLLKTDGLLIVRNTQYRLEDSSVAARYVPLENVEYKPDLGPRFDRNSKRLADGSPSASIFVKV